MKERSRSLSENSISAAILASGLRLNKICLPHWKWVFPSFVGFVTFLTFLPGLQNGFLSFDDRETLLNNPHFRGWSGSHLQWMFTTYHMGPYQPLSWLSYAVDYALWGMNPKGYHLTNILLHCINAVLVYRVTLFLTKWAWRPLSPRQEILSNVTSGVAALFFSIHPLRVESVAWVTERRDVLCGLFFLLACYSYLVSVRSSRDRWFWLSVFFFLSALLSKAIAVGLLWALVALDVYPLRRLPPDPRRWLDPLVRPIWREKIPFILLALAAGINGFFGLKQTGLFLSQYNSLERLGLFLYGAIFYLQKTLWPWNLIAYYELPRHLSEIKGSLLAHAGMALGLTAVLIRERRRLPAGLSAWLCYLLILMPVSGIAQNGRQMVADRYSYLACLPWVALTGAGLFAGYERVLPARRLVQTLLTGSLAFLLMGLGAFTWRQTQLWHDDIRLWTHMVLVNPRTYIGHYNLAMALWKEGKLPQAIGEYDAVLQLNPGDAGTHYNLGMIQGALGNNVQAQIHFQEALQTNPHFAEAQNNLGLIYLKEGKIQQAITCLRKAIESKPTLAEAHLNLGLLLLHAEKNPKGNAHIRRALELQPELKKRFQPNRRLAARRT